MKPKIYGFNNGGSYGFMSAIAMAEDGECVARHCCTEEGYMKHDLGMDDQSTWKHDEYNKKYPDGYELEFVSYDNVKTHEGLQKAIKLHEANFKSTIE